MRKRVLGLLLTGILVCGMGIMAHAEENESYDALERREEIIANGICTENEDGSYTFTLRNENVRQARGLTLETEHAQMSYTIIPTTDSAKEELDIEVQNLRSGKTSTLTDSDSAGCISAYNTIAWNTTTSNSKTYMYLTSVSGGYTGDGSGSYISSGVTVSEQTVAYGQSGFTPSGKYKTQNDFKDIGTSVRSYSFTPSSSWEAIAGIESEYAQFGATYTITLKRNNSTWVCEIVNIID